MEMDIMDQEELDKLLEYSTSIPTGTTIGKKWKCRRPAYGEPFNWFTGEYVPDPDPKMVGIKWRKVVIRRISARKKA